MFDLRIISSTPMIYLVAYEDSGGGKRMAADRW